MLTGSCSKDGRQLFALFGELLTARPFHGPKLCHHCRGYSKVGLDAVDQYSIALSCANLFCLEEFLGVPVTGSFACGCGRNFGHSGGIVLVNLLYQSNQSSTVGVVEFG